MRMASPTNASPKPSCVVTNTEIIGSDTAAQK